LFLNRRGHTRTLICTSCGAAVGCPNCSVALVLHRFGRERLQCHLCGHDEAPRAACAACGSTRLTALGGGTEKVEEELSALLPGARLARLDRDAASGPGQAAGILARFARRELDLMVGTQMVAKGHDFPGVTLVGVLGADERLARAARRLIARGEPADLLGPAPAPLAKVRGKYRWQLLLRARDHGPLHRLGRSLAGAHDVAGVQLSIDIDPGALL